MSHRETSVGVRGFTLLELLMVVIIIGILASMALPQYLKTTERARAAEALTILGSIRGSEVRFKAADPGGLYATALTSLDFDVPTSTLWTYAPPATGGATVNATATRIAGTTAGATIEIDLDSGALCTSNVATYGLATTPC